MQEKKKKKENKNDAFLKDWIKYQTRKEKK